MEKVKVELGNFYGVYVEARGRAGGLALLWDKIVTLNLLYYQSYHMDASIQLREREPMWRFTRVYGWSETQHKMRTGEMVTKLKTHTDLPLLIRGDLNEIFYHSEKEGGPPKPQSHIYNFRDAFIKCGLFDMGFSGQEYTWCNHHENGVVVEECLDRYYSSTEWSLMFPETVFYHIDHELSLIHI